MDIAGAIAAKDQPPLSLPPMPEPPDWFSTDLRVIWTAAIDAAPPGARGDRCPESCGVLPGDRYASPPHKDMECRLRFAAAEVGRASTTLGLVPFDRTRIPIPPPIVEGPPLSVHERFDMILPDGKVVPYAGGSSQAISSTGVRS
jgi:hypothetical protein